MPPEVATPHSNSSSSVPCPSSAASPGPSLALCLSMEVTGKCITVSHISPCPQASPLIFLAQRPVCLFKKNSSSAQPSPGLINLVPHPICSGTYFPLLMVPSPTPSYIGIWALFSLTVQGSQFWGVCSLPRIPALPKLLAPSFTSRPLLRPKLESLPLTPVSTQCDD